MSKNPCKWVLYTQENTWFHTSADRKGEAWRQTDTGIPWLCMQGQHSTWALSPKICTSDSEVRGATCFWKMPGRERKNWRSLALAYVLPPESVQCKVFQYLCSKPDQGLQVWSSRKAKYLWVWTKGRALIHHIFNQSLAEQEDCKHRAHYEGKIYTYKNADRRQFSLYQNSISSAFFIFEEIGD